MKTLDRDKSEEIFNKIKMLSYAVDDLKGIVQNPNFINKDNAQSAYMYFYNNYEDCKVKLNEVGEEVYELFRDVR